MIHHHQPFGKPVFFFDRGTHIEDKPPMPKKPGTNPKGEFALFNVVYEDNSVRSNAACPMKSLAVSRATSRRAGSSWSRTARSPRKVAAPLSRSSESSESARRRS